ncbi:uncharacterized protein LOC109792828 [Cajanus cajan]|uniref:uncharacterized protein LOC109792828 n=1 Tax=Cajanus cajan TaxID=3821 RepID=UPI0010FB289D|nr:uncharacterized protein LOC109792828 [Cajanus cajan]
MVWCCPGLLVLASFDRRSARVFCSRGSKPPGRGDKRQRQLLDHLIPPLCVLEDFADEVNRCLYLLVLLHDHCADGVFRYSQVEEEVKDEVGERCQPSLPPRTNRQYARRLNSSAWAFHCTSKARILTCIPGIIHYNDTKIQLLDLPGIIEGASEGKGRGRQYSSTCRNLTRTSYIPYKGEYEEPPPKTEATRLPQGTTVTGGPGMQAVFLVSGQGSCGTGVSLPQKAGTKPTRKPGKAGGKEKSDDEMQGEEDEEDSDDEEDQDGEHQEDSEDEDQELD